MMVRRCLAWVVSVSNLSSFFIGSMSHAGNRRHRDMTESPASLQITNDGSTGAAGYVGYLGPLPKPDKIEGAASSSAASLVLSAIAAVSVALYSF